MVFQAVLVGFASPLNVRSCRLFPHGRDFFAALHAVRNQASRIPPNESEKNSSASGFMQLREITGKRMIITHLSNHTLGVIITVHDISHLGVKITSL